MTRASIRGALSGTKGHRPEFLGKTSRAYPGEATEHIRCRPPARDVCRRGGGSEHYCGHLTALPSSAGLLQQKIAEPLDIGFAQAKSVADIGGERTVLPVDGLEGRLKIGFLDTEQSPDERC